MAIMCLLWQRGEIHLLSVEKAEVETKCVLPTPVVTPEGYRNLALFSHDGIMTLQAPAGNTRQPFFRSLDSGSSFVRVQPLPGGGELTEGTYRAFPNGSISVVDRRRLWYQTLSHNRWAWYELPPEIIVWDTYVDRFGKAYVVGEVDQELLTRVPGHIFAAIEKGRVELRDVKLSAGDRRRLSRRDADRSFRLIDAEERPIVLASDCCTFSDILFLTGFASHSFVLVEDQSEWNVVRIRTQNFFVVREKRGMVSLYTFDGQRVRSEDGGVRWRTRNLLPSLCLAATEPTGSTPVVTAVIGNEAEIVVGLVYYKKGSMFEPISTSVVRSIDDGRNFEMLLRQEGSGAEVRALCFESASGR